MFGISLSIVLVTLFYMILGFVIRKMNKASETHLQTLSGILIYICNPFLEISAFMSLDFSAVSYTHLDVYKRQVAGLSISTYPSSRRLFSYVDSEK